MISQITQSFADFHSGLDFVHLRRVFIVGLIVGIRCAAYFSVTDKGNTWQKKKISTRLEKGLIIADSGLRTAKSQIGEQDAALSVEQPPQANLIAKYFFASNSQNSAFAEFLHDVFPRPPPIYPQ